MGLKNIFTLIFIFTVAELASCQKQRLRLQNMVRHACNHVSTNMPLILPKSEQTVLLPDGKDEGCYTIGGPVFVKKRIGGSIQIYVETKYGTASSIAPCKGATVDNCGGVGSCIFCDSCGGRKDPRLSSTVQLTIIGKQLDCRKGLNPGNYTDLGISFCLPTLDDFLNAQGISRQKWNQFYKQKGQTIYQTFYIFNEPVNILTRDSLQIAVKQRRNLIGCDAVVANVSED